MPTSGFACFLFLWFIILKDCLMDSLLVHRLMEPIFQQQEFNLLILFKSFFIISYENHFHLFIIQLLDIQEILDKKKERKRKAQKQQNTKKISTVNFYSTDVYLIIFYLEFKLRENMYMVIYAFYINQCLLCNT